ncbi:N-6 DNA methylase [Bacteroidota bacterium]
MANNTNNNRPDIDFEKELWDAANELRGAVAENQYKDFVLSLIFIKHLSERYNIRKDKLLELTADPDSDYYTQDQEDVDYIINDPDEYLSKGVYLLPEEATWEYLKQNAEQDDIKVKADQACQLIEDVLADSNPDLKGVLPPIFVKSQLTPKQVSGIINLFSHNKFSERENPQSDILGRIYEYYIGKFAMAEGSGAGQFFTPGSIVRLMVELLEPLKGRIFDPACGSGGMFVQSMKFVQAHGGSKGDIAVNGQERYEGTLRLCKMNLLLRNLPFDLKMGDSLLTDKYPELKADYILTNPPFNVDTWHPEDLPEKDPRLLGPIDEFTTNGNANYMWMQTFWHHLSDKGTACTVMANGAMTTNTKQERNVRVHMVDYGMIDCIIRLPDKLFMTTGIPACLFILSKNRDGKDEEHRERLDEMLFIDASRLGEMVTRRLRVFSDEDIDKIAGTYHAWRNAEDGYEDIPGFCKYASVDEVKLHDYKLTPGIYVGTEDEEDDGVPFEEKFNRLNSRLDELFKESNQLQKVIIKRLQDISYDT